jgi:hypothetical protein
MRVVLPRGKDEIAQGEKSGIEINRTHPVFRGQLLYFIRGQLHRGEAVTFDGFRKEPQETFYPLPQLLIIVRSECKIQRSCFFLNRPEPRLQSFFGPCLRRCFPAKSAYYQGGSFRNAGNTHAGALSCTRCVCVRGESPLSVTSPDCRPGQASVSMRRNVLVFIEDPEFFPGTPGLGKGNRGTIILCSMFSMRRV